MQLREVVIFSGERFSVPQSIQRIDVRSTHGWQLRYGGTRLFSDRSADGSGAALALERATRELLSRIARLPAPSRLQKQPSQNKTSLLPVGISGPIVRQRAGVRVRSASLSVLLPQFGSKPRCASIYIGSENTYTVERFWRALDRAVEMRRQAEEAYVREETRARRRAGRALGQARQQATVQR